jgi:hypothetical protein
MVKIYHDASLKLSIYRYPMHSPSLEFKIQTYLRGDTTRVSDQLKELSRKTRIFDEEMIEGEIQISNNRKILQLTYSLEIGSPGLRDLKEGAKKVANVYYDLIMRFGNREDRDYAEKIYSSLISSCRKIERDLSYDLVGSRLALKYVVPLSQQEIEKIVKEYRKEQKALGKGEDRSH